MSITSDLIYQVQEVTRAVPEDIWTETKSCEWQDLPEFLRVAVLAANQPESVHVVGAYAEFYVTVEDRNEIRRVEERQRLEALEALEAL